MEEKDDPPLRSLGLSKLSKVTIFVALCIFLLGIVLLVQRLNSRQSVRQATKLPQTKVEADQKKTIQAPMVTQASLAGPGEHCGGFIQNAKSCTPGFYCLLNKIADTGGTCVKVTSQPQR